MSLLQATAKLRVARRRWQEMLFVSVTITRMREKLCRRAAVEKKRKQRKAVAM